MSRGVAVFEYHSVVERERRRKALDDEIAKLVRLVSEVGEARIAAEAAKFAMDNFGRAAEHRKIHAQAVATLERAIDAYVAFANSTKGELAEGVAKPTE